MQVVSLSLVLVLVVVGGTGSSAQTLEEFKEEFVWRSLNFTWPDDGAWAEALSKAHYLPENNALAGIRVWKERIFLTLPRLKRGVPATLVSITKGQASPALAPFPGWDMQTIGNCSALQSVHSIEVDSKGQMWVLDSGRVFTLTDNPESRCRPKLVLLDLQTFPGRVLKNFPLPDSALSRANDSVLVDFVLDTDDTVYISDESATDPGIIVFETWSGHARKVSDATMQADPTWHGMVGDKHLTLQGNINALALTPVPHSGTNRTLFYAPLSSNNLYMVSTYALRNDQLHSNIRSYITDLGNKTSFSQGMMIDSHGMMYLGLNSMDAIGRWDTRKLPLQTNLHVITKDPTRMQWPSTFAIDDTGSLWVISNKLQNLLANTVNLNDINYRVMRAVTNTRSYLYQEDRPAVEPRPEPTPTIDHMGHEDHINHTMTTTTTTDHPVTNKSTNAAESVARPTSVVLTILTSTMTFLLVTS